ncbi:MAG TPA: hypothetical protein VGY31_09930 [Terriglobia bacterium]|nr:hypothetical protein [Terriglobia bacterium]
MAEKPITLFDSLSERYPERDDTDSMHRGMRAVIAAAPFGGSVNELLSAVLTPPLVRRRDEWFKELAGRLEKLEGKVDGFKIEKLADNEQFVSATVQATRIALATHQQEKRKMLQNALLKIAVGDGPGDEMQQVYLNAVETFLPSHIKVLRALWSGTQELINKHHVKPTELGNLLNYGNLIRRLVPELEGHDGLVQCIITDLRSRGFSTLSGPEAGFPGGSVVTNVGINFLRFLMEPEEKE